MPPGYTSLPDEESFVRKKTLITVNDVPVPVVPAVCCLLFIVGLPMWAAGMLTARATTGAVFSDLGVEAASLDRLQGTVLAAVLVLTPVVAILAGFNAWLETSRPLRPLQPETGLSLSHFTAVCSRINTANWVMLLVLTLSLAGTCTWLTDMSAAMSAAGTKDSSGPYWPPAAADSRVAAAPPPAGGVSTSKGIQGAAVAPVSSSSAPEYSSYVRQLQGLLQQVPAAQRGQWHAAMAELLAGEQHQQAASLVQVCPPPCIDLGVMAQVLGLPWPCFCQTWMLADLQAQLSKVVTELSVAMVGAVLLWVSWSWLFGYLAAQGAHAERDLQDLLQTRASTTSSAPHTPGGRLAA